MFNPKNIQVPINITSGTTQRSNKTFEKRDIPIQKFWEELQLKGNIETVMFITPENPEEYPTSLVDNQKKPWGEYHEQKTQIQQGEKTAYPSIICTAGLEQHNKKECVGCYQEEHYTAKPNPWKKSVTTKHQIVHFAFYHNVPRLDKDGNHASYQDKYLYNSLRCEGDACKFCAANVEKVFGKLLKLKLGPNHTKNVLGGDGWNAGEKKMKFCRGIRHQLNWTCGGCGGQIVTKASLCGGCGTIIEDFSKLQGSDPKDMLGSLRGKIEQKLQLPTTCSKCNWSGFPDEASDCCYDAEGKMKLKKLKCSFEAPQRMDLYSSVLQLNKEGAGTDSAVKMKAVFSIDETSNNPYQFEVEEPLVEIVNRAISINGGLFNLDKEIAEMCLPPEIQAKILGVPNAYAGGPRIPGSDTEVQERPKFAGSAGVVIPKQ